MEQAQPAQVLCWQELINPNLLPGYWSIHSAVAKLHCWAGAILLAAEMTSFQPSPLQELPFLNLILWLPDLHFSWGFRLLKMHSIREGPISPFLTTFDAGQPALPLQTSCSWEANLTQALSICSSRLRKLHSALGAQSGSMALRVPEQSYIWVITAMSRHISAVLSLSPHPQFSSLCELHPKLALIQASLQYLLWECLTHHNLRLLGQVL